MPGRTLRDAIAVALEAVPGAELAVGDGKSRAALREFLLGWVKEYGLARGVIFEDDDLEQDLREVIAELRRNGPAAVMPAREPLPELEVPCRICNAKVGERCGSIINASRVLDYSHAPRLDLARKGAP